MATSQQLAILKDFAPELTAKGDTVLTRFLGYAALEVNVNVWGSRADMATALLAAHLATVSGKADRAGAMTQQKVGDLSVSFASSGGDSELDQTAYGKRFKHLRKTLVIGPLIT